MGRLWSEIRLRPRRIRSRIPHTLRGQTFPLDHPAVFEEPLTVKAWVASTEGYRHHAGYYLDSE